MMSSRPDWAEHAIKADDPPWAICELELACANVLDLRDADQCAAWGGAPTRALLTGFTEFERC
ncbi:hypothetical protein [Pseudodonghicola xiamenensis]|uniref:Uncharacterized protein n=1 Tax=Pseudodonghicola xiamenensis TaxID=337702 RepID=A0A8J3HAL1_9RHOB|nr:hypothetical protein [Pseudodonghicola xiamenensis]GHG97490.1 hypothetical protein GCM10010961_32390 [Pseudodonghicola xiamenensis]